MVGYAGVIINSSSSALDRAFTYAVPDMIKDKLQIGSRVLVPFGKGNKRTEGFVVSIPDAAKGDVKEISSLCDDLPLFNEKDLALMERMRERYLCTYIEAIKVLIPSGITKGIRTRKENFVFTGEKIAGRYDKEPYRTIWETVSLNNGKFNKNKLADDFGLSLSSVTSMIKNGFLQQREGVISRYNDRSYSSYSKKELNPEQRRVVERILESSGSEFLIHGVTGSGKTEIYMHLVSEMIEQGRDSIILVPEIALTPQMVERFKGRFGSDISVFHSRLSQGERFDEWFRVKEGKVKVAIGARSALFLPFENLGMIVIDEEHEGSYKSDSDPKYHAREIAEIKSGLTGCKVVLGSATPSLESYYRAATGEMELFTLKERADGAKMPAIQVVDMREELKSNNRSIFSQELIKGIEECLARKEQVILFLNRRGFSTFVSCRSCGYVYKCESCDISLTYHHDSGMLTCHYCGKSRRLDKLCPSCGSKYIKYFGIGTERIESEARKQFPGARTLRMDFDTTRKKDSHESIYNRFKNQEADILIGTQMVAKGLDFKNVTLVGIIAADLSLNLPDFRSGERTFQLITQVSGRAGRGRKAGKVIVQTYNPDNYSIGYAVKGDYEGFFREEIEIRRLMDYPPFTEILSVNMSSEQEELLIKCIQNVGIILKNIVAGYDRIELLGPSPCMISKIKDSHRWQLILKGKIEPDFADYIRKTIYDLTKDVYNSIRVSIDINPTSLL
ncbi:MAG: primosome assembly protein PriA [Firmicutes bacterium]|nr:primosome assembly protein PriA [Bacillota bacterium]